METIKIASTHPESQGPYVLINAEDFDAKQHKLYEEKATKKRGKGNAEQPEESQEAPQE